ncbi:MAG: hypothetical protein OXF06_08035 [Bacteroidetes bacterium]|nr:hypothetical protein [Bacteroidota bacterium]MCY4224773.1 hypothetical protein [Bacteroidota bacterium]
MRVIVPRRVTLLWPREDLRFGKENLSLTDFQSDFGYVLLGEPGMGKSTEFEIESERIGAPKPISARRFLLNGIQQSPLPPQVPIFIDGLDEARLIVGSPEDTIQQIVSTLTHLESPRFRLSCRSNSWLGKGHLRQLSSALGLINIPVLQLDPLHHTDIEQMFVECELIETVLKDKLDDHWLESFLYNPQLLHILLHAIKGGDWSSTPFDIFEKACSQLINELYFRDDDTFRSDRQTLCSDTLLHHAGFLCALLLIHNKKGWTVKGKANRDILALSDLVDEDHSTLYSVIESDIFTGTKYCRTPTHRIIAEFLGARYLSEIIQQGLGWRRVLSLLLDTTGNPFHDLKGLVAWLALFNSDVRSSIIHSNPSVLAFDGDPSNLTPEQLRRIVLNLEQRMPFNEMFCFATSMGVFASLSGLSEIWRLISSKERDQKRQDLLHFLLSGGKIVHDRSQRFDQLFTVSSHQCPDLEQILTILYDPTWKVKIRVRALAVLNEMVSDSPSLETILYDLLQDLKNENLPDEDYQILYHVVDYRFQVHLSSDELWNDLKSLPLPAMEYVLTRLIEKAKGIQIKILLDVFCSQSKMILPQLYQANCTDIVIKLLLKGLETFGDQMDISDLYDWFALLELNEDFSQLIIVNYSGFPYPPINHHGSVLQWLSKRKSLQYKLIEFGLNHQRYTAAQGKCDANLPQKFLGRNVSKDFRSWCLNRAVELAHIQPSVSKIFAHWATLEKKGWADPISDDQVTQHVSNISTLHQWNQKRLLDKANHRQKENQSHSARTKLNVSTFEMGRQNELSYLKLKTNEVAQGRCSLKLLDKFARIYFYGHHECLNGRNYLSRYLNEDRNLIDVVWSGFHSVMSRQDLPVLEAIAEMHQKGERSLFAHPILAVLEEDGEMMFSQLSDSEKRTVLGFYFVTNFTQLEDSLKHQSLSIDLPIWYRNALENDPKAVADSLVSIHRACVRSGAEPVDHFLMLSFEEVYEKVVTLVVRRKLITIFPTKCSGFQLKSFHATLMCILRVYSMTSEFINKVEVKNLILQRLNRKNMDVAQQALLLSAGLCIAQDQCLPHFIHFLATGRKARIRHVLKFFDLGGRVALFKHIDQWSPHEICIFIQSIAHQVIPFILPDTPNTLNSHASISKGIHDLFRPCIQELSRRVNHRAVLALSTLASDPDLSAWKPEITLAIHEQIFRKQKTQKKDLTLSDSLNVLHNGPPSNLADLNSVAVELLEDFAVGMVDPYIKEWRDYWEWNSDERITSPNPKHEKSLRDLFISTLGQIFDKNDIHAQIKESSTYNDRIDLCLNHDSNQQISMVIRNNLSLDIWSKIPKHYLQIDTGVATASGYWIYLVFWFGDRYTHVVSPSGKIPQTSQELRDLLEQQIRLQFHHFISIIVIDVSKREIVDELHVIP